MKRLAIALGLLSAAPATAQTAAPVPEIVEANGRHVLLADGKPLVVTGIMPRMGGAGLYWSADRSMTGIE